MVADVHTDSSGGVVLEEGTGYAGRIYDHLYDRTIVDARPGVDLFRAKLLLQNG